MPTVRSSGAIKVTGISTAGAAAAKAAIGVMQQALVDVGWTVDREYTASTTVTYIGAPWWDGATGVGVNGGSGWVLGLDAFALGGGGGLGDGGYYWYNGSAGQPAPPGVPVQIGSSAAASLGALAGAVSSDPHWNASYGGGVLTIQARAPGHLWNNYEWTASGVWSAPVSTTFGGGYRLVSRAPNNNTAFSVKIVTQYQLLLELTFPELDDYSFVPPSDRWQFWCNPYGFSMDAASNSISAMAPYLRDGSAGPCLLVLNGNTREPLNNADASIEAKALLAGSFCTAPQWAWYVPRVLGAQHPLVTTTNKPLLVDSMIAISPAGGSEERIVGWIYDSMVSTGATGVGAAGELSGANWLAWRCNDGDSNGSLLATVWLHGDTVS